MAETILRTNSPKSIKALNLTSEQKELFWAKVDRGAVEQCWLWRGAQQSGGYGVWRAGRRILKAHRVAWVLTKRAEIRDGLTIDHKCMVKLCCNPGHLQPVTQSKNTLRYIEYRRAQEPPPLACKNGHALGGARRCRVCAGIATRAWRLANPERARQVQRDYENRKRYRTVVARMVENAGS